jgi:hypothetical protein
MAHTEVVLVIRPLCSPVKVDQGFMSGCYSQWFCFAGIGLVRGQDAVGRVRSLEVVVRQPFSAPSLRLGAFLKRVQIDAFLFE